MNTLLTGGASGADTLFAKCAHEAGDLVINYSFEGHNTKKHMIGFVQQLSEDELALSKPYLELANKVLKRSIPNQHSSDLKAQHVYNLLARNYYQIKDTTVVYAVAPIDRDTNNLLGGTAWAVQMALNNNTPVFVFDIFTEHWYAWNDYFKWIGIDQPFKPIDIYTGIGSRQLTQRASQAIVDLYQ